MHLSKAETKYKKTINDKGKGKHDKGSLALCQMLIKKPAMANAYCLVNNNGQIEKQKFGEFNFQDSEVSLLLGHSTYI
jgi:hypothetical protein